MRHRLRRRDCTGDSPPLVRRLKILLILHCVYRIFERYFQLGRLRASRSRLTRRRRWRRHINSFAHLDRCQIWRVPLSTAWCENITHRSGHVSRFPRDRRLGTLDSILGRDYPRGRRNPRTHKRELRLRLHVWRLATVDFRALSSQRLHRKAIERLQFWLQVQPPIQECFLWPLRRHLFVPILLQFLCNL